MEPNQHVSERFSALSDGLVSADEKQAIEQHLAGCAECRAEWAAFDRAVRAVRQLPMVDTPPDFSAGVIARIQKRSRGRFFGQRRWTDRLPYEILSVIMLAAIVAIYIWLQLSQPGLLPK